MRQIKYISPSSFFSFTRNPKAHYIRHLSDQGIGREPQTIHMAMGSAFDAFIKAQITNDLQVANRFDLKSLFEAQVDPEFRSELWPKASFLLEEYKSCGAYGVLVEDMGLAQLEPKFEFDVVAEILGVPIFGKPDAFYKNKNGTPVVLDWKVNSFLSGNNMAKKYFILSHQTGMPHKSCSYSVNEGLPVMINHYLEEIDDQWAFQQFVYAIGLGCNIGDRFITSIDQVTGGPSFYTYRAYLSPIFQIESAKKIKQMWEDITTGYIFRGLGLTREESDNLIKVLDGPFKEMYL